MNKPDQFVVFTLDERRYALNLGEVDRIVRMVEVTPLPDAPDGVLGVVNVQGRIIPVINIHGSRGLPRRETCPDDRLIIARTSKLNVALLADTVGDVIERKEKEVIRSGEILPGIEYAKSALKLDDGIILILDLDTILSPGKDQLKREK